MYSIPSYRAPASVLTRAEFDRAVVCMPDRKAVGLDGIPAETIKLSTPVREAFFLIIDISNLA